MNYGLLIEKDKRGLSLTLSQSGEEFYVPSNVFIIATMNTTDKSIFTIIYCQRIALLFVLYTRIKLIIL